MWGINFENLVKYPPSWYKGYERAEFNPAKFGNHIESMLSNLTEELAPNPIPRSNIGTIVN